MSKPCPTPYKQAFSCHADAVTALANHRGQVGRTAVKVYRCPCERWHLAGPRKPVTDEVRGHNRRRKKAGSNGRGRRRRVGRKGG